MLVGRPSTLLRLLIWTAAAAATARVWLSSAEKPSAPIAPSGVILHRDLTHRVVDGRPLGLDLYLPAAEPGELHPVLIAVHGGSWTGGSKTDYGPQLAHLALRGIAIAAVDYRLARPDAPGWPGAPADVTTALDWLVAHAGEHRLDPARVAIIGTSAGGLLAALAGSADPRVRAVVCVSAPMDLGQLIADRKLAHEPALVFLGRADRPRDASPIARVGPEFPPLLLIHGTDDLWVSIEQARNMQRAMETAGATCRLIEIERARHGLQLRIGEPAPRDLSPEVIDFLNKAWGTPAVN